MGQKEHKFMKHIPLPVGKTLRVRHGVYCNFTSLCKRSHMTCFYQSSAGMCHMQTRKRERGQTHKHRLYRVQVAFKDQTVLSWSTDIACVNSMNKAVLINIVQICCCFALEGVEWGENTRLLSLTQSLDLLFSLRLKSLTEHRGDAVKSQESLREGERDSEREKQRRW